MNLKFIKALNEMNTMSLPDIGALVRVGNRYTFNHFLKYNDGRFSAYLQKYDGLLKEEADQKVNLWISEIKNQLNSNGLYVFEGVGILFKEGDNKFRWEQTEKEELDREQINDDPVKKKEDDLKDNDLKKEFGWTKDALKEDNSTSKNIKLPEYEEGYLSIHFNVKRAKDEIKRINSVLELEEFSKGDQRSSIQDAIGKQLKKIHKKENKVQQEQKDKVKKDEPLVSQTVLEPTDKEVKDQIENESKILETIKEKEKADSVAKTPSKFKMETSESSKVSSDQTSVSDEKELDENHNKKTNTKLITLIAIILIVSGCFIIGFLKLDLLKGMLFKKNNQEIIESIDINSEKEIDSDLNDENQLIYDEKTQEVNSNENNMNIEVNEISSENIDLMNVEKTESSDNITTEDQNNNSSDSEITSNYIFHSIVGSFKIENNAINLLTSLLDQGYESASIIHGSSGFYYVQLGSFSSKEDALRSIKESNLNGWVLTQ